MTNVNIPLNSISDRIPIYYGERATSWVDIVTEKVSHYMWDGWGYVAIVLSNSEGNVTLRLEYKKLNSEEEIR
jgi:hypothetical protein